MIHLDQPDLKTIEHAAQQMHDCISFAQGALRIGGVDKAIKEKTRELLHTDNADYYSHSLGLSTLRNDLAQWLSDRYHASITHKNVIVSHGSINGIAALCLLLLDAGDEVLLPEPTYPPYMNIIAFAKAQVRFVSTYKQELSNNKPAWFFDKSMLEAAVTPRTKMLIIAHPSNPCGVSLTQQELNELSNWCEQKGIYCIVDEAYDNYFFDTEPTSSTALIPQGRFTIRTGSFSKMFGMSGWRVGFVVAPEHIINNIAGVQDGLIVCPTVISQYAALYALQHTEIAKAYTTYMHHNRDIANDLLQPLMAEGIITFAKPSAGFFLFLQTQEQDTTQLAYNLLNQAQVAIVPGRNFGPSGKPFLRLCYARRQEQVIQGIERLVTFLQ